MAVSLMLVPLGRLQMGGGSAGKGLMLSCLEHSHSLFAVDPFPVFFELHVTAALQYNADNIHPGK